MKVIDISGKVFGHLRVLHRIDCPDRSNGTYWRCKCKCGNTIDTLGHSLREGKAKSCGCSRKGTIHKKAMYIGKRCKHGGIGTGLCEYCGNSIIANRSCTIMRQRFCSIKCGNASRHDANVLANEKTCDNCGKRFVRTFSERTRRHFCSTECVREYRTDDFSIFRYLMASIRCSAQKRGSECSITIADLKSQWEKQSGRCAYTGWPLSLPVPKKKGEVKDYKKASLDRINSSIGYIPSNIQFVSMIANYAKNEFSEEVLVEFCRAVVNRNCLEKIEGKGDVS